MIDSQLFTVQPLASHHITDGIDLYVYNKQSINTSDSELSILIWDRLADQFNISHNTSIFPAANQVSFSQSEYVRALGSAYLQYRDTIDFSQQMAFLVIDKHSFHPGFFIPEQHQQS